MGMARGGATALRSNSASFRSNQHTMHTLSNPIAPNRIRALEFSLGARFVQGRVSGCNGRSCGHEGGTNDERR